MGALHIETHRYLFPIKDAPSSGYLRPATPRPPPRHAPGPRMLPTHPQPCFHPLLPGFHILQPFPAQGLGPSPEMVFCDLIDFASSSRPLRTPTHPSLTLQGRGLRRRQAASCSWAASPAFPPPRALTLPCVSRLCPSEYLPLWSQSPPALVFLPTASCHLRLFINSATTHWAPSPGELPF